MKIKKGDKVRVNVGKDKGREGVVDRVYKKQEKLLIQNINVYKKHVKKNEKMPQGGIIDISRPIAVSKVVLICPKCGKATRIGFKFEKDKKRRFCKKCDQSL